MSLQSGRRAGFMNGRRKFFVGTILSIQNSSFIYPACQNCCSRLILISCRYKCYKCGTSYKNATHRYKLCVKVSEEQRLHIITIFGKCLEKIFGASADSWDLEQDRAQELLFQAAERCLIGRSFIFAVKISGTFDRSHPPSHSTLHRNMVACQVILLKEDSVNCTILNYFNLLVASVSSSKSMHTKTDVSTDATNRDLSELGFSESNSSLHPSCDRYADYWQQSLGLVSSPLSSTLCQGECSRAEQVLYLEAVTSANTTVCMQQRKRSNTDLATLSSSTMSISTPRVKCSFSKHIHTDTHSLPNSHFHSFSSKSKTALGQESCLQNVCKSGSHLSQSCSACIMQLPLQTAEIHQAKEEIWEDFTFSESLSEFIAKIEDSEGVRPHFAAKQSKTITRTEGELINERECRRSCYLMTVPDAKQIQNGTTLKEMSPFRFDKCRDNESDLLIFIPPCKVIGMDDTSVVDQTFPSAGLLDALLRDSTREQDWQNPGCSKMFSNRTYIGDSWDLCSFIEDLDKSAMSLEKGISNRRDNEPKRSDVDMEMVTSEVKSTMTGDHYNASADLFEASNNPKDNGSSQSQLIGSPNRGQGRLLFSITDSPCMDLLPHQPTDSCISVSSVIKNYEPWNNLPTEDFACYLQSTPLLRRLSGLTVDALCFRTTSSSRSSIFSIRTKSSIKIRHNLLKNTRQRKSAVSHGLSENDSLWSPNFSPFFISERSTAMIVKNRRTMLSHKLRKKESILENKEGYETLRQGHNDDLSRTLKGTDCGSILGEDSIKHGGDAPHNRENRSPVNGSLQKGEDRLRSMRGQLLPSDWSPELFPGKSNASQPHECLQRRLF